MNNFHKKYQVKKLSLEELELLEDSVEDLIKFRSEEEPDSITEEQRIRFFRKRDFAQEQKKF